MCISELPHTFRTLRTCVVIPTYNNAGTLRDVIERTLKQCEDVFVVDDGSTDGTHEILQVFSSRIRIVSHPRNLGKGKALKSGLELARKEGFRYAVTLDSDGQHYPEDLPLFAKAIAENFGSLIIGRRPLEGVERSGGSSFANKFANFWFHVQTWVKVEDTQSGFRAYPLRKIKGLRLLTSRYEAELELLVLSCWHGVRLMELPINVYYPSREERVSHFRPAYDFARISVLNTVLCVLALVYALPLNLLKLLWSVVRTVYALGAFLFFSLFVATPIGLILFKLGRPTERKRLFYHRLLYRISRLFVSGFPGARTTINNRSRETFEKGAMIVCNHQSHLDIPVLMSLTPKLIFLTNHWVWTNPLYGCVLRGLEYMPSTMGTEQLLPRLKSLVERGYIIAIFPEGTRSVDCRIDRFHQGPFLLARQLGLPLLPMVLHGVGTYLPKHGRRLHTGNISLDILPRMDIGSFEGLCPREMASQVRKLIRAEYQRIEIEKG